MKDGVLEAERFVSRFGIRDRKEGRSATLQLRSVGIATQIRKNRIFGKGFPAWGNSNLEVCQKPAKPDS